MHISHFSKIVLLVSALILLLGVNVWLFMLKHRPSVPQTPQTPQIIMDPSKIIPVPTFSQNHSQANPEPETSIK